MEFTWKKRLDSKGGPHGDVTWRFLYPLMLVTTICSVVGFCTPFWFFDEECADRGLIYDCCKGQNDTTSCLPAAWFSEGSVPGFLIAALVLASVSIIGAVGGTVSTIIVFIKGIRSHFLSTRSVIFVGFASGSMMLSSCLLVLQELGHYSVGKSFYICLISGVLQVIPIVGFMFSKNLVGF
ncbi:uncharacterized protein LOC117326851 [Pecten maximus]|uniref:uncharacterized protein LOC117326851 n=1 Tax=Pecten maximus TaxID=6579 RepID=UPI001458FBD0|nr:uncharacterized protein LOC117326851 [Pecten maximus]